MFELANAIETLRVYLKRTNADDETYKAFNVIRDQTTSMIGSFLKLQDIYEKWLQQLTRPMNDVVEKADDHSV